MLHPFHRSSATEKGEDMLMDVVENQLGVTDSTCIIFGVSSMIVVYFKLETFFLKNFTSYSSGVEILANMCPFLRKAKMNL